MTALMAEVPLVDLKGIGVSFGGVAALSDATLRVGPGEIVGF
jgi:ABC-type sugar transport system ATPase subunit